MKPRLISYRWQRYRTTWLSSIQLYIHLLVSHIVEVVEANLMGKQACCRKNSGRSQRTKYGEHLSETLPINIGLPQGSVLGPLLFNIYINDLANISEIMKLILWCDDSTLYLSDKNTSSLIEKANTELHNLYTWVTANRLTINTEKTVAILFSTRKVNNIPTLFIKNNMTYDIINRVSSTKFLGIHYDERLNFTKHINVLSGKLSKLAGMIYSLHQILPTHILKKIYNAHVNSLLNYNTPIWCCNYTSHIKPIHLLQKRIIRNVTKSKFDAHSLPLFKDTKILTIFDVNKLYMGAQFKKWTEKYISPLRADHNLNTRNSHILRPPQHGLSLVRNSFFVQGPMNYNLIPLQFKLCKTLSSFKRHYKNYLLSNY